MKMTNQNRIYIKFESKMIFSATELSEIVYDWYVLNKIISSPHELLIETSNNLSSFSEKEFTSMLQSIKQDETATKLLQEKHTYIIKTPLGESRLILEEARVIEYFLVNHKKFKQQNVVILDYLDHKMTVCGKYAYVRDYAEYLMNNLEIIKEREEKVPEELEKVRLMKDDEGQTQIDCSQFFGYDLFYKNLCFTSCWKMWFSDDYYHIVPKQAFLDVQQVDDVKELFGNVVRITIFDEPLEWAKEPNYTYQKLFRRQLGFEQLEWSNGVGVLHEPFVEFIKNRNVTQMIQYQNKQMQPSEKTDAVHFTTRTFNYEQNFYAENRCYGKLNSQAYFPFTTGKNNDQLAYWILNTEYSVDDGEDSFLFYIDYYLKAKKSYFKMGDNRTKLYFYLRRDLLEKVPRKRLIKKLRQAGCIAKEINNLLKVTVGNIDLFVEFRDVASLKNDSSNWRLSNGENEKTPDRLEDKLLNFLDKMKAPK